MQTKSIQTTKGKKMTDPIIHETQKALTHFQMIKRLLVDFEDLKKAIEKNDNREIGRLTFVIEKLLNHLYVGFGGEPKK
jgi:hypothetical protein